MNGAALGVFWEDQSKPSLALITALRLLDQEEPNMSRPAGCMHAFCTGNSGLGSPMHMQNLARHATDFCDVCSFFCGSFCVVDEAALQLK